MATSSASKSPNRNERLVRENERLKVQLAEIRKHRMGTVISATCRTAVRWLFGGFFLWKISSELAGKITYVDAKVDAAVNVCKSLSDVLVAAAPSWVVQLFSVFGLITAIWLLRRRNKLYRNLVLDHGELRKKYELLIDPDRTSSGLAVDGLTHDRDKL